MRSPEQAGIGSRIAQIRASASQRDHAARLGVPLRSYQNYERGEVEPDQRTLLALRELGWSIDWVLTGEGPERLSNAAALPTGVASQVGRLDRETLARAERILTMALEMARVKVGATARSGMLGDLYEELLSRNDFSGDAVLEISQSLQNRLQAIRDERDARDRQEAGATAGEGAPERD